MTGGLGLEILLRGIAAGAQIALALALARTARNRALRIATLLFIGANLAFVLNGATALAPVLGKLRLLLWVFQLGSVGLFWLFAVTLFEDRPLRASGFAPAGVLIGLGLIVHALPRPIAAWGWGLHNLLGLAFALHAMLLIFRSARVDLVEARRRLRVPVVAVIALYSALLSLAQIGLSAGISADWYPLADALAQAALGLLAAATLIEARGVLFGRAEPAPEEPAGDPDALWIERLTAAMQRDALWRREGLTIADLAQAIGLPEHRLRRLINDRLGHRNFPAFINQQRIDAAKAVLTDPGAANRTVASIAFDLGFASLGPFNRAFREATGLTPTEFRRRAFAQASPIS